MVSCSDVMGLTGDCADGADGDPDVPASTKPDVEEGGVGGCVVVAMICGCCVVVGSTGGWEVAGGCVVETVG